MTQRKFMGKFRSGKWPRVLIITLGLILFISAIALADETKTDGNSQSITFLNEINLSSNSYQFQTKICYNGEQDKTEYGRDYCIFKDGGNYSPCANMLGRCGRIVSLSVQASEENSFIPLMITYSNSGVMEVSPVVLVKIQKKEGNLVESFEAPIGAIEVNGQKDYTLYLNNSGLGSGDYEVWVSVITGNKEVIQKFDYNLLSEGTLVKQGEFSIKKITPSENYVEIVSSYKNTKDAPYSAQVDVEFYKDGMKLPSEESKREYFLPGETKEIVFNHSLEETGNYTFIALVKGTNLVRNYPFEIKPKIVEPVSNRTTGNFMLFVPQLYSLAIVAAILVTVYFFIRKISGCSRSKSSEGLGQA